MNWIILYKHPQDKNCINGFEIWIQPAPNLKQAIESFSRLNPTYEIFQVTKGEDFSEEMEQI